MKILKKEKMKQFLVISIVLIVTIMLIMFLLSYVEYQNYKVELNKDISAMVGIILQKYPEQEVQIVRELLELNPDNIAYGQSVLEKYGISPYEKAAISSLDEEFQNSIWRNVLTTGILGILLVLIFIIYIFVKDRKLDQIVLYLQKIRNKDYSLKVKENTEEEISELQNEIYKITVMLQEQAEKLEKDKKILSDSLSDISHQLKTPLTSICVMVDILGEKQDVPENKRKEFLYEIARQLEWINWLVISLLKLSKLEAGAITFKKEKVEVKELTGDVIKSLSISIELKNIEIEQEGNEDTYYIGDYNWSKEAIVNIVKNCIEHSKEGKKIKIKYSQNPLHTEIIIQDEGEGIAKEDIPYIFNRFYKGKNPSKDSVGIGLALSKSIMQEQGGDITAKSIEGVGTVFFIKIYRGVIQ